ncbi:SWIM zinc finger family protein [Leptolyngbya sp. FACHB-261]|uniref:SWIM zinc finger family protein n=1 Tax=Leptolyngbya sp. FACHB-261 TaxID=2692806 RepID=UPI00168319D2|nr:SWIM zinc finger family protein [Leptolyngbya sp. FACHB-261]MBD2105070.1 SWIM zinc finger family protein [Leptolyngbya sp. FACHB-261]
MADTSFTKPVANNRQGRFATSLWGERFERLVETANDQNRLLRGRTYARQGRIVDLKVETGRFEATVQGSYSKYKLSFNLPTLDAAIWDKLAGLIRAQPGLRLQVLAGQWPPTIVNLLDQVRRNWLPLSIRKLSMTCSCYDYGNPCKHIAAVCYFLVEQIDRDPTLLLVLLGADLKELQALVQSHSGAAVAALDLANFWAEPEFYVSEDNFLPPKQNFMLLQKLGAFGSARDTELVQKTLEVIYQKVTEQVVAEG